MKSLDYDTADGIQRKYLTDDLEGLHRLIADRRMAGYERKERLTQFILFGKFFLDDSGNFSVCEFHWEHDTSWLAEALPSVLELSRLTDIFGRLRCHSRYTRVPTSSHKCLECGVGWTLANCHDAVALHRDDHSEELRFQHKYCAKLAAERQDMQWYREKIELAGLGEMLLSATPNEYMREEGNPWCLIRTPSGSLKVGWRKRVINIDWSDVVERKTKNLQGYAQYKEKEAVEKEFHAETLFPAESTTKGETLIHAWGDKKLVEYLTKLSEVLKIGKFKP